MKKRRIMVPLVASALVLLMGSTALAETAKAGSVGSTEAVKAVDPSKYIEEGSEVSARKADGDGVSALATVTTAHVWRNYKSLVGLTVARHDSWTTWTWSGGYLYSSPKGIDVDWWTAPLNNYKSHSQKWDWFTAGQGGTGRSNTQVQFVFGVPTPWGPVGSSYTSRIRTTVNGYGNYSYF